MTRTIDRPIRFSLAALAVLLPSWIFAAPAKNESPKDSGAAATVVTEVTTNRAASSLQLLAAFVHDGSTGGWTVTQMAGRFVKANKKQVEDALVSLGALGLIDRYETNGEMKWRGAGRSGG